MQENGITLSALLDDGFVGIDDVLISGLRVLPVIKQEGNVFFVKAVHIHDVLFHVEHIVPLD